MNNREKYFNEYSHLAPATVYKMFKSVEKVARGKRMEVDDIIGYAYEGLLKAINTYDETKAQFNTHAINNIRWHVMRMLDRDDNYKRYKTQPNSKENDVRLEYMDKTLKVNDAGSLTYHEVVASDVNVYEEVCGNVLAPKILDSLTDKQRTVLLLKVQGYTHREIGDKLGVSHQAATDLMRKVNYRVSKIKNELQGVI
jgi:RNA polymerase sigma factor (sigma-70 family)